MAVAILITLGLILLTLGGYALYRLGRNIERTNQRIARLEEAAKSRMPYRKMNGVEDATAIAISLREYLQDAAMDLEAAEIRRNQLLEVLHLLRSEPDYDPDRANRKPKRKDG